MIGRSRACLFLPLLAAVLAGACTSSAGSSAGDVPRVIQPGAPGETSRALSAEEIAELDIQPPVHTPADVAFMQGMIVHHAQALEMTDLVPERAAMDDLPLFAERMTISQADEIAVMSEWLSARGEEVPDVDAEHADHSGHAHDELMPGMLTEDELAELRAASAAEFDRLFLVFMQRHHEGALQMVSDLFAAGGGGEPEIFRFANHVDADQRIELARIATMLADLDAAG